MKTLALVRTRRFVKDTRGANMVEYIILVGVVALLCVGAFTFFSDQAGGKIREQGNAVGGINAAAGK
jgi:Flp pilus assembly pilin Flp